MKKFNQTNKKYIFFLFVFAIVFFGIVLGVMQLKPPRVNEASPYYPAYVRMMGNIERLAAEPHPSGSVEIERVRAEILTEIEAMGLSPLLEDASYTADEYVEMLRPNRYTIDEWQQILAQEWESGQGEQIAEEYGIYSQDEWW